MGIFSKNPQISYHINMSRKVNNIYHYYRTITLINISITIVNSGSVLQINMLICRPQTRLLGSTIENSAEILSLLCYNTGMIISPHSFQLCFLSLTIESEVS